MYRVRRFPDTHANRNTLYTSDAYCPPNVFNNNKNIFSLSYDSLFVYRYSFSLIGSPSSVRVLHSDLQEPRAALSIPRDIRDVTQTGSYFGFSRRVRPVENIGITRPRIAGRAPIGKIYLGGSTRNRKEIILSIARRRRLYSTYGLFLLIIISIRNRISKLRNLARR